MIQTHYVPLERPYRIVYTGGVMGLQVGTLIVVKPDEESITTRTHPVVSYVNKKECDENVHITDVAYTGTYSEAVVWNKVDQSEVMTVCLEGQEMKWEDYLYILTPLIGRCTDMKSTSEAVNEARRFFHNLRFLGGDLQLPPSIEENGHFVVGIDYYPFENLMGEMTQESFFCTDIDEFIPFAALTNDNQEAYHILQRQLRFYKSLLQKINPQYDNIIKFRCVPSEELPEYGKVKEMVDKLNRL